MLGVLRAELVDNLRQHLSIQPNLSILVTEVEVSQSCLKAELTATEDL